MQKLSLSKISRALLKVAAISTATLAFSNAAHATVYMNCNSLTNNIGFLSCPHWYVSGNLGYSYVHDKPFSGTPDYVSQNGIGLNVNTGYQFMHIWCMTVAGELGYTQYADSREYTPGSVLVGRTEHYTVYGAAVGQIPIGYRFSILGKLGLGYGYARKNAYPTNFSRSANANTPYYGFGLAYNVTPAAQLVGQWNRNRGNGSTGSTDLLSLGVTVFLA